MGHTGICFFVYLLICISAKLFFLKKEFKKKKKKRRRKNKETKCISMQISQNFKRVVISLSKMCRPNILVT